MVKKKSCQNVRVPRVLSMVKRELYGWVDEEIFTQPSVIEADALPELRREMRLMADRAVEGDYVLEAAGPSNRGSFCLGVEWRLASFISMGGVSFAPSSGVPAFRVPPVVACVSVYLSTPRSSCWKRIHVFPRSLGLKAL
ncbi:hypothetical protein PIB30_085578 [Stylosanthes scabra]|uniref:Uncharacterized protein n=1 Tax=Stylosanthes scabra TaxID=79078 RepID=A0ABU6XQZ1_9FABA|nr:hypothetical protein [Stylosanthes scabra]